MKCRKACERLNAYLDGELAPHETLAIQEHLRACPRCAAELDELKRLNGALEGQPLIAVPAGFARRVRAAGEQRRAGPVPIAISTARLDLVLSRVAAVVMVAAGLWIGGLMARGAPASGVAAIGSDTYEAAEFDLQLDALSAAPPGSVAEVCLTFADQGE